MFAAAGLTCRNRAKCSLAVQTLVAHVCCSCVPFCGFALARTRALGRPCGRCCWCRRRRRRFSSAGPASVRWPCRKQQLAKRSRNRLAAEPALKQNSCQTRPGARNVLWAQNLPNTRRPTKQTGKIELLIVVRTGTFEQSISSDQLNGVASRACRRFVWSCGLTSWLAGSLARQPATRART